MLNNWTRKYVAKELLKRDIILLSEYTNSNTGITCKCHCGKIFTARAADLILKKTSCGCKIYQYAKGNKNYQWTGYGELSGKRWDAIQSSAKLRGKFFNLTIENAWDRFILQERKCALTGVVLTIENASLDRVDSSKGYTIDNIQWLHKIVQGMKWSMSDIKFIKWCRLVVTPIKSTRNYAVAKDHYNWHYKGYKGISLTYFNQVLNGAKSRGIDFSLCNKDLWDCYVRQAGRCALTGIRLKLAYKSKQTASIDRIDSTRGYTVDNIQWVHKVINTRLKRSLCTSDLYKWCKLVVDFNNNK